MFYCDTSFVAPLVLPEVNSDKVEAFVQKLRSGELAVSLWTKVEFNSLVSRRVRMGELSEAQALEVRAEFDRMLADSYETITPAALDYHLACEFLENHRTGLRAGDALHLAIARNRRARKVFTLDEHLVKAARMLRMSVPRIPSRTGRPCGSDAFRLPGKPAGATPASGQTRAQTQYRQRP